MCAGKRKVSVGLLPGRLEGGGKFRRLKVRASADLKGIEPYLAQACANANDAS